MSAAASVPVPAASSLRRMLVPLALAQFICSFAGSNMNVMINDISHDLHTTVQGVQVCITLFLLVMAALMIPCGKLTDRLGRKRCFTIGLIIYGIGAVLSAVSPGLGVLILGNSIFEGIGTALLIPPVYILTTMLFTDMKSRAWAFGLISRHWAVDRRRDHHSDLLAVRLRVPGPHHRDHRAAVPRPR
jgi:MFS family permease